MTAFWVGFAISAALVAIVLINALWDKHAKKREQKLQDRFSR